MTTFFKAVPPRIATGEASNAAREFAAAQAFTALDFALSVDQDFHPVTWQAVKGTVFEQTYRRAFPHHDFDSSID
jgi:hypothetical protein